MSTITKEMFGKLLMVCEQYDPFTQYIEDYKQMDEAKKRNEMLDKTFINIMFNEYNVVCNGIPLSCQNAGDKTNNKLILWLKDKGFDVEKPKRIWSEQEISDLVQGNDIVLYRALLKLYACQTMDEKANKDTIEHNGIGFNGYDAKILSSMAEFLNSTGFLTDKQKFVARKKMVKYTKQLTKLANA